MDSRYESFCAADPLFYEASGTVRGADFHVADEAPPDGWQRNERAEWVVYTRDGVDLPPQGWKVHVSACLDNAPRVLSRCRRYFVDAGVPFKFLRSPRALLMRNSKYAHRGSSGKLVTAYPLDEAQCERVVAELDALLAGEPGPYILSDLRINQGPVYVRYGGYAQRWCLSEQGETVHAIADDTGTLVPDKRGPVFEVPPWLELPAFLAPHLAARNATTVADLPYQISEVLHFSNGGGLYKGTDTRSGDPVVLKEARPHAGLDASGADAVSRQDREHRMLTALSGLDGVPAALDRFTLGEHRFLVLEEVPGRPLNTEMVRRYPMTGSAATPEEFADYARWAVDTSRRVERVVDAMHERGVVHGDLHLFNVMVRPDDSVCLLDFEVAADADEVRPPTIGNQGFAAPRDRTGVAADRYALACLRLALFLPLTALLRLAPDRGTYAAHLAAVIGEHFPLPDGFLAEAVGVIRDATTAEDAAPAPETPRVNGHRHSPAGIRPDTDPVSWPAVRDDLTRAILASATPERPDRLFPGDIEGFRPGGGLNLAHGAAGVLYALSVTGAGRFPEHERWLIDRALAPAPGTLLGLYDGLFGVAYLLDRLGHRGRALDLVRFCLDQPWQRLGSDLSGGLAGVGLVLLRMADRTGEAELARHGLRAAELVAERLGTVESVPETSGGAHPHAGLLHGSSGPAMLFLRCHQDTGDERWLDLAATALGQDLRRCVRRPDGALEVNEGWRTMPYLAAGSVGVGLALDSYLARRADDRFDGMPAAIRHAAGYPLYVQPGLFAGRAGIVLYLAGLRGRHGGGEVEALLRRQARALSWHAVPFHSGLAFPGEQLLRLSMDLATGTAGVLLALGAVAHHTPVHLPLLAAPKAPAQPARVGSPDPTAVPKGR